jgi:O-antigen/teichoic acid export membrane protein
MELHLRAIHIARSAAANWAATVSTLVVSYFLAPFLVHRLGNAEYGVWVLALSITGSLYLLDLGLRSSVLRFVSSAHAASDHEEASRVVSAAFWVRLRVGGLTLLLATIISIIFPRAFHIPEPLGTTAQKALFVIGLTVSVSMPVSAISAVISALNRYDLQSYVSLLQLAIRAGGVVLILLRGKGILAIAICELSASLVGHSLSIIIVRSIYPELRIRMGTPTREVLRPLWSYGSYSFILLISMQLIYQTDNLIVGACISTTAVTLYSIGNSLCRYAQQLFSALTNTFVSAASVYEASGSRMRLRGLYLNGTRIIMALSLPILMTLIMRPHSFIGLWMGPQYSRASGTVARVLAIALTVSMLNSTASSIALGTGRHKPVAIWTIFEALFNVLLSILLARRVGLVGVAVGTLTPSIAVNLFLWPRFIPQIIEVGRAEILRKILVPAVICATPFAVASMLMEAYAPPQSMATFIYQTLLLLPIFYLAVIVLHWESIKGELLPRLRAKKVSASE